jgi:hypothetical protein
MNPYYAHMTGRADWLCSPLLSLDSGDTYGIATGPALRDQRKRQAAADAARAAGASQDFRDELRARLQQAARLGWTRPPTCCAVREEVGKLARGLARRLCDGSSLRGRAHLRSAREAYRRNESATKWWGDLRAQCAAEIESALWQHAGQLLARAGVSGPSVADSSILRAVRSRWAVVRSLRAGERILRRMAHRTDAEDTLSARADEGAPAARWQPEPGQVERLREAIRAGARNAPTAARMLALLDSILSGRLPSGKNAAATIGRMLTVAAAGWPESAGPAPAAWRAWVGVGRAGRPAKASA